MRKKPLNLIVIDFVTVQPRLNEFKLLMSMICEM